MTAREIIAAIPLAIQIGIRSWLALWRGKRHANRGVRAFRKTLSEKGLPGEIVENLTSAYKANLNYLSIHRLSQMVIQSARR
jgi:hypothetical protein